MTTATQSDYEMFIAMDKFTTAYVDCALWSSNDESTESGGYPLDDNYKITDIHPDTLARMIADCKTFQAECSWFPGGRNNVFPDGDDYAGHDFWLTRNRHGAGFWDRGYGQLGDDLTVLCDTYGSFELYVGDDGLIYGS
jgi:hypothetical protein